jgi:hypothetical protein
MASAQSAEAAAAISTDYSCVAFASFASFARSAESAPGRRSKPGAGEILRCRDAAAQQSPTAVTGWAAPRGPVPGSGILNPGLFRAVPSAAGARPPGLASLAPVRSSLAWPALIAGRGRLPAVSTWLSAAAWSARYRRAAARRLLPLPRLGQGPTTLRSSSPPPVIRRRPSPSPGGRGHSVWEPTLYELKAQAGGNRGESLARRPV